jgi:hypothetical protein
MFNTETNLISDVLHPKDSYFDFNNLQLCINHSEKLEGTYRFIIHEDSETNLISLRARKNNSNGESVHLVYLDSAKNINKFKKIEKDTQFFVLAPKLDLWISIQDLQNYNIKSNDKFRVRDFIKNEYKYRELEEGTMIFNISNRYSGSDSCKNKYMNICFTNNLHGSSITIYDIENVQIMHYNKWIDILSLPNSVVDKLVVQSQLIQFIRESYLKFKIKK